MAATTDSLVAELHDRFQLPSDDANTPILAELQSIIRIHEISPDQLFFKWESYCIKMGAEETQLNFKTVRDFKKDLKEMLEREVREKADMRGPGKRIGATPRTGVNGGDMFDM
jgi:DNA polymerase alpha subunit B